MKQPSFSPAPGCPGGQITSLTLLNDLRKGSSEAWGRLMGLYGPLISYWCRQSNVRPEEVDDICQGVYVVVLKKLDDFHRDKPGDSFRGWLRGITRNIIRQQVAKSKQSPPGEGGTDANLRLQEVAAPEDEAEDPPEQVAELIHRALALIRREFSDRDNRVFNLYAQEKMSAEEVAKELGMTPENVRRVKSRIVQRVQEELGDA